MPESVPHKSVQVSIRFNPVPMYRALGRVSAHLALLVARDPKRRWKLRYRIERIDRRAGRRAA